MMIIFVLESIEVARKYKPHYHQPISFLIPTLAPYVTVFIFIVVSILELRSYFSGCGTVYFGVELLINNFSIYLFNILTVDR